MRGSRLAITWIAGTCAVPLLVLGMFCFLPAPVHGVQPEADIGVVAQAGHLMDWWVLGATGAGGLLSWGRRRRLQGVSGISTRPVEAPAEAERRSAELLSRHIRNTPLAVIELDYSLGPVGVISTWSGQAQRIFGWTEQEVLGRTLDEIGLVHDADQARRHAAYQSIRDDGLSSVELTARTWTRDQRMLHCTAHISVARRPDGAIDTILMFIEDVTARIAIQAEITHLAHHDALTGLANRTLFHDRLRQALNRARRDGDKVALMLIDVDSFKQVNDTHGHACGDALLLDIAQKLSSTVRETDSPARLGGDEFALVQVAISQDSAAQLLAKRLIAVLAQPFYWEGLLVERSCSIGVAIFPGHGGGDEALLRAADVALYRAKGAGRNRFVIYSKEMDEDLTRNRSLQAKLAAALERRELELVYQPILALPQGEVVAMEALCRWRGSDGNWIPPSSFLPLAESCGLIKHLGEWVLRTACAQGAAWAAAGRPHTVAVNLSLPELLRPDLVPLVREALAESGLAAGLLQLEVTERVVGNPARAAFVNRLHELAALGVRITIDDFGAGHCPLADLAFFPFDMLKIDAAMVDEDERGSRSEGIARGIVLLAESLGKRVVAEKVETGKQLDRLAAIGCHAAQGYFLHPPLPPEDVPSRLAAAA